MKNYTQRIKILTDERRGRNIKKEDQELVKKPFDKQFHKEVTIAVGDQDAVDLMVEAGITMGDLQPTAKAKAAAK